MTTIIIIILCIFTMVAFTAFLVVDNDGAPPVDPPDYTSMANRDVYINRDNLYK